MDTCKVNNCNNKKKFITRKSGKVRGYHLSLCALHFGETVSKANVARHGNSKIRQGYEFVRLGGKGQMYATHRIVMEQKIGRKLRAGESVHHINGIKLDNRPENLELWVGAIRYGQRAKDIQCPHCGKAYERT